MLRDPDLITKYTQLLMRGYYKLGTICIVIVMMAYVTVRALRVLWVAPETEDRGEVPDQNEWVDDMMARTDIASKYRVHNAKLEEIVSRGGMSPTVARDATRNRNVFDRRQDRWSDFDTPDVNGDLAVGPRSFNPTVTLSGV